MAARNGREVWRPPPTMSTETPNRDATHRKATRYAATRPRRTYPLEASSIHLLAVTATRTLASASRRLA